MPSLSQNQIDFISACYKQGRTASATSRLVPCSASTVWRYYQELHNGAEPKVYDYHRDQPVWRSLRKPRSAPKHIPEVRKPLNDDKRFYHSTFEPS